MNKFVFGGAAFAALLGSAVPVLAQDSVTLADGAITLSGGVGVVNLHAEEIVYLDSGDPTVLSLLLWDSTAPLLTTQMDVKLPEGWTLRGQAQFAMGGDSYMEDYDWIDPASYDFDDWSHRSQHEATDLEWYFNGSLLVGHDLSVGDGVTVNLNGGLKYTYARWTAYGGNFVYSTTPDSPRDAVFSAPDDEIGITYQQHFPAAIAGLDATIEQDDWTFDVSAHGGMTFLAYDIDNHWQRTENGNPEGLRFEDIFVPAPLVSVAGKATFAVSDSLDMFVGGTWEQIFTARGDTDIYAEHNDDDLGSFPDGAGGNLGSFSLTAGLTGTF